MHTLLSSEAVVSCCCIFPTFSSCSSLSTVASSKFWAKSVNLSWSALIKIQLEQKAYDM